MQRDILFVQPKLCGIGGIERTVPLVARELRRAGYRVHAATLYDDRNCHADVWDSWTGLGEGTTRGPLHRLLKAVRRAQALLATIAVIRPALVIVSAQGVSLLLLLGKAVRLVRQPVCVYVHQSLRASDPGYGIASRLLYRFADAFIAVSDALAAEIRPYARDRSVPIVRMYNPVDMPQVAGRAGEIFEGYARPYFVTASRLERIKGVDVTVEAFLKRAQHAAGTLFVLGEGSLEEALRARVIDASLEDRVRFLGPRDDVSSLMAHADAYVSCAREEAFGVSLVEALAAGIPVVATDAASGPREILAVGAIPESYPFKTAYGYLLPPLSEKESAQEAAGRIQDAFDAALDDVTSGVFDPDVARARARDFEPALTVAPLRSFLGRFIGV